MDFAKPQCNKWASHTDNNFTYGEKVWSYPPYSGRKLFSLKLFTVSQAFNIVDFDPNKFSVPAINTLRADVKIAYLICNLDSGQMLFDG